MITALLSILIAADVALVVLFIKMQKRQLANQDIIHELSEERAVLSQIRDQIQSDLRSAEARVKSLRDQVQILASEAEQEVKQGVSAISKEVDSIISDVGQRLDEPLKQLAEKQHFVARLARDAKNERELLARVVTRAENAARLLSAGQSWQDIVDQMEDRRFSDIRAMLSRGHSAEKVAKTSASANKRFGWLAQRFKNH